MDVQKHKIKIKFHAHSFVPFSTNLITRDYIISRVAANIDFDIRRDRRIREYRGQIFAKIAISRSSRRSRKSQNFRAFLKKKRKKSTKVSIFTLFAELFSPKLTFFAIFANITGIRARSSRPRIPQIRGDFLNIAIFSTPLLLIQSHHITKSGISSPKLIICI